MLNCKAYYTAPPINCGMLLLPCSLLECIAHTVSKLFQYLFNLIQNRLWEGLDSRRTLACKPYPEGDSLNRYSFR
jgi:hypothetical protein